MTVDTPPELVAEQCVIGSAILTGGRSLEDCPLRPEEFAREAHRDLWALLLRLNGDGSAIDQVTLPARLAEDPIRGVDLPYLHQLISAVPATASAGWYAKQVREAADLRAVRQAGTRMAQASTSQDAQSARSFARQVLDGLDTRDTGGDAPTIGDLLPGVLDSLERSDPPGLPTGWPDLDERLGGLRPGALYVLGARPGLGKSAVALNMAWHVAHRHGRQVLVHSLEMPSDEVVTRLVSSVSQVSYSSLAHRRMSEVEWRRVAQAQGEIADAPLRIDDRATITVPEIRAQARRAARGGRLGLVVVDYLQLVSPSDQRAPREQQVATMSREFKLLAKDLDAPVLLLAQLNRQVEARQDKHPTPADLRESGAVEQDADVVLLLYRDEDENPELMEIGIGKNRGGPRSAVRLHWDGAHMQAKSAVRSVA